MDDFSDFEFEDEPEAEVDGFDSYDDFEDEEDLEDQLADAVEEMSVGDWEKVASLHSIKKLKTKKQ